MGGRRASDVTARRGGAARGRCRGQCVPDRPPAMSRQSPAEENLQGKAAATAGGCGHCPASAGWGRHCPRSAGRTGAGPVRVAIWVIAIGDARRRAVHRPCRGREAGWMCCGHSRDGERSQCRHRQCGCRGACRDRRGRSLWNRAQLGVRSRSVAGLLRAGPGPDRAVPSSSRPGCAVLALPAPQCFCYLK